ncbi:ubiquitin-protein ligase (E3) [Vanrija albida]|uniref:HECT-type E3 ubiquitin transferase n=1 Tax=Vanrija albida TaxID=181172 RepID=A0ABR3QAB2_9TREE
MWNPDGSGRHAPVNLSTHSSSSSSALLSSIRAERAAREEARQREAAATVIQSLWRGRSAAARVQNELLDAFESGHFPSVERGARALVVLLAQDRPATRDRVGKILEAWTTAARQLNDAGKSAFAEGLADPEYLLVLALVCARILGFVSASPRTQLAAHLLSSLDALLEPTAWGAVPDAQRAAFVSVLASQHWVETAVAVLQNLVAASLPKKKHASLQPLVRLLTPAILPVTTDSPLVPPLVNVLLAVPSLASSIPIASVPYLTTHLALFSALLPAAAATPAILTQNGLSSELGRTHFLANLATFGITGGLLARNGTQGMKDWMKVVGTVIGTLAEGWGQWVERASATGTNGAKTRALARAAEAIDSDDETSDSRKVQRPPLAANVSTKLLLLTSTDQLSTVASFVLNSSAAGVLGDFADFALGILKAFRGSTRWEGTLDALLEGKRGRASVKQLWREGVRGKWSSSRKAWDNWQENPNTSVLLLLSHLYSHYLLLTPDDEFFAQQSNPLSLDEVLDLSTIWRDLAFWGYMNGVAEVPSSVSGTEEVRSLFTRAVTRVAERNARHKFAPDNFWVMQTDLQGFVQAVKDEDHELSGESEEHHDGPRFRTRHLSRRQLAFSSPRLGLLNNLPMAVPFNTRLQVFREFVRADQERLGISRYDRRTRHRATIRRTNLAEDGFRQLNRLGPALKGTIEISFVDKWGQEEAGIDGGGLFKEFLTEMSKEAFDTERGLWLANYNNELYPNPHSYSTESHQLQWYGFIGRVLGKALYEDILVDVTFAGFFLAKWLGRQSYLDDLASLDRELYRGLVVLKNYPDPEELSLNFTITEDDFGVAKSIDLVPGGSDIVVTAANRHEYIQLVCRYKLDKQIAQQSRAFFSGLSDIIDPTWLRMFDQQELAQLLGGEETPIDLTDLRQHAQVTGYEDGYTPQLFWKVVAGFTQEERRSLLRFVTGCSRPPLLGFGYLNPGFAIRNGGADVERLPTASSCANLLKLPDYKNERVLRTKLLQAINSGAGFDMS